jgi:hypothetical protein
MKRSSPTLLVRLRQSPSAMVLWLAVSGLAAPPCSAQVTGTLEFSPVVGTYVARSQLPYGCYSLSVSVCSPVQQRTAIAVGGRMAAWITKRIAVEGSLWYSPSSPADVVATSMRVLLRLTGGARTWVYVVGGPAFVGLRGYTYAGSTGGLDRGGVVGIGGHFRVARSLALRAEVEQYRYSFQTYRQQDFFLSLGLSVASRIGSAATP